MEQEDLGKVVTALNKKHAQVIPVIPHVGKKVIWHDSVGTPHDALVTSVWSATCINVVFVTSDENKQDSYGRQIERATSCQHKSIMNVHGYYWRFEDEEPNGYVAPMEQ